LKEPVYTAGSSVYSTILAHDLTAKTIDLYDAIAYMIAPHILLIFVFV